MKPGMTVLFQDMDGPSLLREQRGNGSPAGPPPMTTTSQA